MKTVITEKDIMKQYTKLVANLIEEGRIMKGNRGSNSMYEFETHFEPSSPEFNSLIIALERKPGKEVDLGFQRFSGVDIYDLVVKDVEGTFDDGKILYSKTFIRFTDSGKYFYVSSIDEAIKIQEKRDIRWSRQYGMNPKVWVNPSEKLLEMIKHNRGFANAKKDKLSIYKTPGYGYTITNNHLKTKPSLTYKF